MPTLSRQYILELLSAHEAITRHLVGARLNFIDGSFAHIEEIKLRGGVNGPLFYALRTQPTTRPEVLYNLTVFTNIRLVSITLPASRVCRIREDHLNFCRRAMLFQAKSRRTQRLINLKRERQAQSAKLEADRQAQAAELERERQRRSQIGKERYATSLKKLAGELSEAKALLTARGTHSLRTMPRQLMHSDARLVLAWSRKEGEPAPTESRLDRLTIVDEMGEYDAARLFSARAAEVIAMEYYTALGHPVIDVSISQLSGPGEWVNYDLLVGEKPVDVKNARRSFSSPDSYVEHCVPRFKVERSHSQGVIVCGVLSDYVKHLGKILDEPRGGGENGYQVLGETSRQTINAVCAWLQERFGKSWDFSGAWRLRYQPGWSFEFPNAHYPQRASARIRLREIIDSAKNMFNAKSVIPHWAIAISEDISAPPWLPLDTITRIIISDLNDAQASMRISRPLLYLYIMAFTLEGLREPKQAGKRVNKLRNLLMVSSSPFGLEDPLGYVDGLLGALERAITVIEKSGERFTHFRMVSPDILRGRTAKGKEITIFSHCGGWDGFRNLRCGFRPLVIGIHRTCDSCGYLICTRCGTCSQECPAGEERVRSMRDFDSLESGPEADEPVPF